MVRRHTRRLIEGGSIYFVRADYIGRLVFATESEGTKAWEAGYLPFGGVDTSTGSNIALRFPGQWFQSESGLHQYWMREYDPTTGGICSLIRQGWWMGQVFLYLHATLATGKSRLKLCTCLYGRLIETRMKNRVK